MIQKCVFPGRGWAVLAIVGMVGVSGVQKIKGCPLGAPAAPWDTLSPRGTEEIPYGFNQYDEEMHRVGGWMVRYDSGLPRQWDTYADDRLNGPSMEFAPNGQLVALRSYRDGLLDGVVLLLDHSGQWVERSEYLQGRYHGTVTLYYGNGKPKEQRTYLRGILNGPSTWFYDNGNPMAIYPYANDQKQGLAQYFYDNGALEKNEWFENNVSIRWETYDLDGTKTKSGKSKEAKP
jgi:hypothetical protein